MELLCPHCLKKVTVSDDKAGQVLNCPLCQGVFAAPALAPAPSYAPPPAAPPPPKPDMPPPVSYTVPPPAPQLAPPSPPQPPKPAPPPGEYTRKVAFRLRPDVLVWFPPVCLFLIVVLSFFYWHTLLDMPSAASIAAQVSESDAKRVRV